MSKSEHQLQKSCFIITPLGDENSSVRRNAMGLINAVISPVLKILNINFKAAHQIHSSGSITNQIVTRLLEDDLVIANLTGLNPNVMYELAVRHAKRKPVVVMAESSTELPFDVKMERTIFYNNDMFDVEMTKQDLIIKITEALNDPDPDNPIYRAVKHSVMVEVTRGNDAQEYILQKLDELSQQINNILPRRQRDFILHDSMIRFAAADPNVLPLSGDKLLEKYKRWILEIKKTQSGIEVSVPQMRTEDLKELIFAIENEGYQYMLF